MFCGKCGIQNPENAMFCQNCGIQLSDEEMYFTKKQSSSKTSKGHQAPRTVAKPTHRKKNIFRTITVIAIIVFLFLLAWFAFGEWYPEPIQFNIGIEFSDGICGDFRITLINCRLTRWLVSLIQSAC